jgi:large subunit ribosomal protein L25
MAQVTLEVEPRSIVGKQVKQLRNEGWIPAVLYGHNTPATSLQVDAKVLRLAFLAGAGHGLVQLQVAGEDQPRSVLMREVQRNPITRRVLHLDFQEVVLTEKLRTGVPVTFVGTPALVESGDAVLLTGLTELEVECLPGDIPSEIQVDVSALTGFAEPITVGDIALPEGVIAVSGADETLATLVSAREEELVEEEEELLEGEEPELIRRARDAEEEPEVVERDEED